MKDSFLGELPTPALLRLHAAVIEELRERKVVRSKNNPVGDYTEWLVAKALGLSLKGGVHASVDAEDSNGTRYQIKGRRVTPENKSVQMGGLRKLDAAEFDYLIAVVFNADFTVMRALRVPYLVVKEVASFKSHTNCHILHARPSLLNLPGVEDITEQLRQ